MLSAGAKNVKIHSEARYMIVPVVNMVCICFLFFLLLLLMLTDNHYFQSNGTG